MQKIISNRFTLNKNSKILFIYPHPDDETYFNAGLIQKLVKEKIEFEIICLTKGGAGKSRFNTNGKSVMEIREMEFKKVMNFLQVKNYSILDFKDGGLKNEKDLESFLQKLILNKKATYIVSFEPNGIYGHSDHVYLTELLKKICEKLKIKLTYSTVPKDYTASKSSLAMSVFENFPPHLDYNIVLNLSLTERIKKIYAIYLYKSQFNIFKEFTKKHNRCLFCKEYYNIPK